MAAVAFTAFDTPLLIAYNLQPTPLGFYWSVSSLVDLYFWARASPAPRPPLQRALGSHRARPRPLDPTPARAA